MSLAFVAERPFEPGQTVTLTGHVVTGAIAVDAVRTGLATAVAKETRRTDWEHMRRTERMSKQTRDRQACGVFEHSLRWQVVPLNPDAHSHAPSSGEHDAPFLQLQDREQLGPQRPSAHTLSQ